MDAATSLSLDYLAAIEHRLSISWDKYDQPVFLPDRVDPQHVYALRYDLNDLMGENSCTAALDATREYGQRRIQTVGFGLVKNFDQFVKLGLVYGERLILWDVIGSRLVRYSTLNQDQIFNIGAIACNLLLLRNIVEEGGVVILPAPPLWCKLAKLVAKDLLDRDPVSPAVYGLSTVLSTGEDGFVLHPYTLLDDWNTVAPHEAFTDNSDALYSKENSFFHLALARLFRDERFAFLSQVSAREFYRIANNEDAKAELRKIFLAGFQGLSEQQFSRYLDTSIDDLAGLMRKRRESFLKYAVDAGESSLGLIATTAVAVAAGRFDYAGPLAWLTAADLSVKLVGSFRKWQSQPNQPVIIQAFQKMNIAAAAQEQSLG